MLVLSRRQGETIKIGREISIAVNWIRGNVVSLAVQAPREIPVVRGELVGQRIEFEEAEVQVEIEVDLEAEAEQPEAKESDAA